MLRQYFEQKVSKSKDGPVSSKGILLHPKVRFPAQSQSTQHMRTIPQVPASKVANADLNAKSEYLNVNAGQSLNYQSKNRPGSTSMDRLRRVHENQQKLKSDWQERVKTMEKQS